MTPLYHQAFPTGHSRFLTLTPVEIMLYVGLPGLYPLPVLWRMAPTLSNPNPNPHPNPNRNLNPDRNRNRNRNPNPSPSPNPNRNPNP